MTHRDVDERDLVTRYVRKELSADEEQAFEEHYFACEACFADVQAADRLRASVRDLAARGGLSHALGRETVGSQGWRRHLYTLALAASLVLAIATGWQALVVVPGLKSEVAAERDGRLADARQRAGLELASARQRQEDADARARAAAAAEPNIPLVILHATRGDATAISVRIPADAQHLVLWIETPGALGEDYRLILASSSATAPPLWTIENLKINAEGALSAAVPATDLAPGSYTARLLRNAGGRETVAGEYRFTVTRLNGQKK